MASSSIPALVYSYKDGGHSCNNIEEEDGEWLMFGDNEAFCFYNVVDKTSQVKPLPGLDNGRNELRMSTVEDGGWVLLRDRDSENLFLYNLTSFKRIAVPSIDDDIDNFTFALPYPPSHPNSSLVAVKENKPYWLQCHPGADKDEKFTKHAFHDEEFYPSNTTGAYQGKVYVNGTVEDGSYCLQVIDPVSATAEHYEMSYSASIPTSCSMHQDLVVADGDLFMVSQNIHDDTVVFHSADVLKLDLPNRNWVKVNGIGDRIFFVGYSCSVACRASPAGGVKGNRIYLMDDSDKERPCCYDLDYGCLITYMPCVENKCPCNPQWVVLPQNVNKKQTISDLAVPSIKTPYLFFTAKNDGNYTMVDPFSKACYSLALPQLAGALLYSSQNGWLVVHQINDELFLFNIFTQSIIQLPGFPPETNDLLNGLALSAPPTSSDCMLFGIADPYDDETTEIIFCKLGDHEWTKQVFLNEDHGSFSPAHNSAVFHNGFFHSLGLGGSVGVYNHNKQTWTVLSSSIEDDELNFDVGQCYMLELNGKLLSVLMENYYDYPRKVVQLRDEMDGWEDVTDLRDELLFVGRYGSILAPAPNDEWRNSICLPKFKLEGDYQPVIINPWNQDSNDNCFYESIEYTLNTCWVMPPREAFRASEN